MADPAFDIIYANAGSTAIGVGGTITFQYPAARAPASYAGQWPALLNVRASQAQYTQDTDFSIAYGPTSIVVTFNGVIPIAAGAICGLQIPLRDTSGQPNDFEGYPLPDSLQSPAGL